MDDYRENGYFLIARKLFSDPLYQEKLDLVKKKKPVVGFYRFDALVDLFRRANFRQSTVCVGNQTLTIERGQVFISAQKMADYWGWSHHRVDNFLRYLGNERDTIGNEQGKHYRIITLCNYDEYQDPTYYEGKKKESRGNQKGITRETGGKHPNELNELNEVNEENKENKEKSSAPGTPDAAPPKKEKVIYNTPAGIPITDGVVDDRVTAWNEVSQIQEDGSNRGMLFGALRKCEPEEMDRAFFWYWYCVRDPDHTGFKPRSLAAFLGKAFYRQFFDVVNPDRAYLRFEFRDNPKYRTAHEKANTQSGRIQ